MKKFTALLLSIAMVATLCACGSTADTAATDATAETAETTEATETTDAAATEAAVTVKAGFICLHDENSTYDLNFINAAKEACEKMGIEYVIKTNIPEGQECYEAACELADAGCNFIFADSFGHEDYMIEAAKEYPDVQFCHATGTKAHTENVANFHNAFASIYEGRYLAGIVAGMKLNEMIDAGEITAEEAKMGYIGAYTYAEVISGYTSFYLGAKSVCPSVTMEVTFTGSWYDETAEKEGANTLINDGCVLISQHADSMGAPTACETAGVPNVSYNGSTASACPNTFLVSSRIDWAPYFEYAMGCVANGTAIDTDWVGTLATGSVKLTDLGENVAEGTADAIAAAQADIESGKTHVFDITTFTVEGAELSSYQADVDTDPDYAPDHEVITDGYFNESGEGFRSAPYFDVKIDGITLLDTAF
ncbi:BMP family ABC transporter substrate-binding protein [Lacrimispora saccharolytica]|uniref:BMP family ABC transporter substrate-binding protein n=1 Tax=Lacrimispora saccharolytica TaxID=84030 RepID=UPI00265D55A3|nr:BMP family ABC transporter substrate-binding protein [Lacrimispora saccharolytica]MCI7557962.1 BMP family ABC transporter substrate-binding protein [Lachnospiraceae bacterium]MCF2657136.1 BMP family ABC transporter substrate-binding protein [Lacrimispora saccharolytica]MDD7548167.1 BMP family ABC transporter substrate-binding protein [Lachnospiraceae bacterium]MDY4126891.1 BMP family ABC transporter substrate-binding protein [Lachnospiraceae bacterium]MDY5000279.1 BMP family ABC transporter